MKYPSLKRVAQSTVDAHAALALWPRRVADLAGKLGYSPLPHSTMLVEIDAYRHGICWSGFVDLAEWFDHAAPELASLAASDAGNASRYRQQMQKLFEASGQPLQMPLPELAYDSLRVTACAVSESDDRQCHLCIVTPQGRVWLTSFPLEKAGAARSSPGSTCTLPLEVEFRLGSSPVSRRLLAGMRCGDVLLIGREAFEVFSADQLLGQFLINEDGEILVQELNENKAVANAVTHVVLNDIPLQVDFVLQRSTMAVAELDALYRGQVIALDPHAEKQIVIMVNGIRLAKGELVELNGRLGIELSDIADRSHIAEVHRV